MFAASCKNPACGGTLLSPLPLRVPGGLRHGLSHVCRERRRARDACPDHLRISSTHGDTEHAETRDRTGDLQIFSLTLSQLSYRGLWSWRTS